MWGTEYQRRCCRGWHIHPFQLCGHPPAFSCVPLGWVRYLYLSKHRVALSERARRWPPPGSNLVVGAEGRLSTSSALVVTLRQRLLVPSGACYEHQQSASKSNARAWDWVVAQWISLKTTIREPLRARLWGPGNPHAVTMLWMDYDYITASALPHLSCLADC